MWNEIYTALKIVSNNLSMEHLNSIVSAMTDLGVGNEEVYQSLYDRFVTFHNDKNVEVNNARLRGIAIGL